MNLLYIHQYFKTPKEPGGTRSYWIAKALIDNGYQVTMITSSSQIERSHEVKEFDGITVHYLKVNYNQRMSIIRRVISFFDFMFKSIFLAFRLKGIEGVIATSTPLTVGIPALFLKRIKKFPYIFEVRDLWPEVPIQLGGLNNKFLQKMAKWLEKKIYEDAEQIVALSPGMEDGVIEVVGSKKTFMIPNMAKIDEFYPQISSNSDIANSLGLNSNSFKAIHFGSMGFANGLNYIIEAAELLKDENVEFVFVGAGAVESELKKKCTQLGLDKVKFLGRYPMEETAKIVDLCDVSIVSFLDIPILYTNSPNKLFDSLSAGKPIIVNSAGWTKKLVEENKCGFYVDPLKPSELKDRIVLLQKDTELRNLMGKNSRSLATNKYDKSILCKQFVEVVNHVFPIK